MPASSSIRRRFPIARSAWLVTLVAAGSLRAQARDELDRAARSIRVEDVRARIAFLAGDALMGRATPSPGLSLAADSIAAAFRAAGLRPAGDAGGYVQRYRFQVHTVAPAARRLGFVV